MRHRLSKSGACRKTAKKSFYLRKLRSFSNSQLSENTSSFAKICEWRKTSPSFGVHGLTVPMQSKSQVVAVNKSLCASKATKPVANAKKRIIRAHVIDQVHWNSRCLWVLKTTPCVLNAGQGRQRLRGATILTVQSANMFTVGSAKKTLAKLTTATSDRTRIRLVAQNLCTQMSGTVCT